MKTSTGCLLNNNKQQHAQAASITHMEDAPKGVLQLHRRSRKGALTRNCLEVARQQQNTTATESYFTHWIRV